MKKKVFVLTIILILFLASINISYCAFDDDYNTTDSYNETSYKTEKI